MTTQSLRGRILWADAGPYRDIPSPPFEVNPENGLAKFLSPSKTNTTEANPLGQLIGAGMSPGHQLCIRFEPQAGLADGWEITGTVPSVTVVTEAAARSLCATQGVPA